MPKQRNAAFERPKTHLFLLVFAVLALFVILTPLQHYMPLGRFQHYGICIFVFGLGYIAQAVASWPRMKVLPRFCYILTGLFFSSAGAVLINNPWFDSKMMTQTSEELSFRHLIYYTYGLAGAALSASWLAVAVGELKTAQKDETESENIENASKKKSREGSEN
ncbi:unnamed protein product [Sphagnum balticum]